MAVRSKDDTQAFKDLARTMFFSNATIDEYLACASAAQARAICTFIEIEQRNRAANKHAKLNAGVFFFIASHYRPMPLPSPAPLSFLFLRPLPPPPSHSAWRHRRRRSRRR